MWQHELRALQTLMAPILVTQLAQAGYGFIDTVMAGQVSPLDLASVAVGASVWLPLYLLISGIVMATTPLVAAAFGAGRHADIPRTTHQALWLGLGIGVLGLLVMRNISFIFPLLDVPANLQAKTRLYLEGVSLGMPAVGLFCVLRFYSEALGHTRPVMVISVLGLAASIPVNYVFIHGLYGLPKLGGPGCGWATSVVMTLMLLALGTYALLSPRFARVRLLRGVLRPDPALIWRIFRLGAPIGAAIFFEVSVFACVAALVSPFGEQVVAAHQVSLSVTSLLFMVPLSLAISMTIRTGHAYGRRDLAGLKLIRRTGLTATTLTAAGSALFIIVFRHDITGLYTDDPAVRALAADLLLFAAGYQIFDALQVGAAGCLRGVQDTRGPMLLTLIAYWLVALPVGYGLAMYPLWQGQPQGAYGFWFGLVAGLGVACLLLNLRLVRALRTLERHWQ